MIALAKSAYWKMNSFSFDPPSTQLWFTLIELNCVGALRPSRSAASADRRRTAACWCSGRSGPPGTASAVICAVTLHGQQVLAVGGRVDAVLIREQPERVDDLERVLLRALEGAEEVRLVPHDRPAGRSAELLAPVVLLVGFGALFRLGLARSAQSSRNSVNQLPRISFVPLFVMMFITPPLLRPYSAL